MIKPICDPSGCRAASRMTFERLECRRMLSASIVSKGVQPRDLTVVGSTLYFSGYSAAAGRELWSSDGTPQKTRLLADDVPGPAPTAGLAKPQQPRSPGNFRSVNGSLLFAGEDAAGQGLFRSDGTAAKTTKLSSVRPTYVFSVNSVGYFIGGQDLWRSDGTAAGTKQITGGKGLRFGAITEVAAVDNEIFALASDRANASVTYLFKTDGTTAGTTVLHRFDIPAGKFAHYLAPLNHKIMFQAPDEAGAQSLWESDGTAEGTAPIIGMNTAESGTYAYGPFAFKDRLYFFTSIPDIGEAVWTSDGSAKGTIKLAQISSDTYTLATLPHVISIGSTVFFSSAAANGDPVIWSTNGTVAGTSIRSEFALSDVSAFFGSWISHNQLIYFGTDDYGDSQSVFAFDGTHARRIAQTTDKGSLYGPELTVFDNKLFFATDQNLWSASLLPSGSVRGVVFSDDDQNGVQDKKENALTDFSAWLDVNNKGRQDASDPTSYTDALGRIAFNVDLTGTYALYVKSQGGFKPTTSLPLPVTLSPWKTAHVSIGEFKTGTIFGNVYDQTLDLVKSYHPAAPLAGARVFLDANGNGRFDPAEIAVRTDAAGYFEFDHLQAGKYSVCQTPLGGPWTFLQSRWTKLPYYFQPPPGNPAVGVVVPGGGSEHVTFSDVQKLYPVHLHAFFDANRNGLFDTGEEAVEHAKFFVDENADGLADNGELSYRSGASGSVSTQLPAGMFVISAVAVTVGSKTFNPIALHIHVPEQKDATIAFVPA